MCILKTGASQAGTNQRGGKLRRSYFLPFEGQLCLCLGLSKAPQTGLPTLGKVAAERCGRSRRTVGRTLEMLSSSKKAARYRQQAARLRDIVALNRSNTKFREQLIDLAGQYERLAERAVGLQRPQETGSPPAKAAPSGLFVS